MKIIVCLVSISLMFHLSYTTIDAEELPKLIAAPDIVPPATDEMQHPEFWISRITGDPDRLIMTPDQIKELDKKNRSRTLDWKDINGKTITFDPVLKDGNFMGIHYYRIFPLTIESMPGDSLRVWMKTIHDYIENAQFWDRRHLPYPAQSKQRLIETLDEDSIPETIVPEYGIIVKHTLNRVAPSFELVYPNQYGWLDRFQNAILETGMPVAILHRTRDSDWYYVRSEYSLGWVSAGNVAVGSVKQIKYLAESENFVVATAHKVPIYADREFKTWITDFYMGARLRLVDSTGEGYRVQVPYRREDGSLESANGWIKPDADVSIGFQPYTQRNVITTIFKLLNRPYGWGGTDHERDCVGTIRAVFRTFGICMPRWTTYELYSADHVTIFPADTPKNIKYRYLDECPPGITVCGFNWHVVLYLGKVDGVRYVIHQNGYSYHDADGTEVRVGRVSVNHTELEGGADIRNWTELSVFKP
ncbi:MAG: SH3 domain-containing protein [Candidatus Latescibacteria bacterium]|nr:SH3 domain-containing protein [Candidatus Latescibacterota bacterium]